LLLANCYSVDPLTLHCFPTRRSSDLGSGPRGAIRGPTPAWLLGGWRGECSPHRGRTDVPLVGSPRSGTRRARTARTDAWRPPHGEVAKVSCHRPVARFRTLRWVAAARTPRPHVGPSRRRPPAHRRRHESVACPFPVPVARHRRVCGPRDRTGSTAALRRADQ